MAEQRCKNNKIPNCMLKINSGDVDNLYFRGAKTDGL